MSNEKMNLIIVAGQQGVGKSTIVRALLKETYNGARIDCTDIGHVNPWEYDVAFLKLVQKNVVSLIKNFWDAGYQNVIVESPFDYYEEYVEFRRSLPESINVYMAHLCASKEVRDVRRINRSEPSTKENRDLIDSCYPEEQKLQSANSDYLYMKVQNENLTIEETMAKITEAIPEIYNSPNHDNVTDV